MSEEMGVIDWIIYELPLITIVIFSVTGIYFLLKENFLGLVLLMVAAIITVISLKKIPADPPNFGILTILGERKQLTKREGLRLRLPGITDFILINAKAKNKDFNPKNIRSKDLAEIIMQISATFFPDPENAITYQNAGGEEGVYNQLDDMIEEVLRRWAIDKEQWTECLASKEEANIFLIKEITNERNGDNIKKLIKADGKTKIKSLGIILTRFNLGLVDVAGELKKAAEKKAKETQERAGETVELNFVRDAALELADKLRISVEAAIELIQTERGKVSKQIIRGLERSGALPIVQIGAERTNRCRKDEDEEKEERKRTYEQSTEEYEERFGKIK